MKRAYLLFLALTLTALAGCSNKPQQQNVAAAGNAPAPLEVRVAPVQTRQVEQTISVTGSLAPDETVTVSNEVAGTVAEIKVDFGQLVRKGDVIAELDKRELRLRVERARAALTQAMARIGLSPGQEDQAPDTTPAIRQAQAQLEDARSRYESAEKLVKSGDISNERFVELEKTFRAREAAVDAARDELRTMLANIEGLKADLKLAEKTMGDATIRAPFSGSVSERLASPGQYLRENTAIVTLVKTTPLRLRADIPESAAAAVRVGTSLTFSTQAIPGQEFEAVVREVNPSLDPRSRSLTAEARLTKNDDRLRPGMFVQVRLVTHHNATIVVAPKEAIQTVAGLTKIFKVEEGRAEEVRISRGREMDGWVEIRDADLKPGTILAVSHLASLVTGTPVQAVPNAGS
ncbi:MAG: efflux RND transporter periplasmic adaptor subunit [Bryobacteraceae bacterium]|nr:efflux RND transporter periplasmic adaptor subunit [Bryobacteraceae bacterium]